MIWVMERIDALEPSAVLAHMDALSTARRMRVQGMKSKAAQVCAILAELLLRHALHAEYGLTALPKLEAGEKGKPFFPDFPDLCFSLSHCQTAVACALDASPVGVDVQEVRALRRTPEQAVPSVFRVLSDCERCWVLEGETPSAQDRRFAAVWTCKEAYGKALGVGILYDLRTTAFLPQANTWTQSGFFFQHEALDRAYLTLCANAPLAIRHVQCSEILEGPKRS